jgi:hypothetical protein
LENFRGNTGVVQLTSEEYTGPLHFVEFWLDVVREWESETGEEVVTGLSATKDVQDAILADPVHSQVIDVIDIRYWAYRADGSLYAPQGGQHLAPRQHARLVSPGKRSFDQVYRAVSEYKSAHPEKAVIYSEGQYPAFGWAAFMAGGSLAAIPQVGAPGFLDSASSMRVTESLVKGVYLLKNDSGDAIVYLDGESDAGFEFSLPYGKFNLSKIDPETGKMIGKIRKITGGKMIHPDSSGKKQEVLWIRR